MRRSILALVLGAALALGIAGCAAPPSLDSHPLPAWVHSDHDEMGEVQLIGTREVHEDDPEWDCTTMGNQTCGVTADGVTYLIEFEDGLPVKVHTRINQ